MPSGWQRLGGGSWRTGCAPTANRRSTWRRCSRTGCQVAPGSGGPPDWPMPWPPSRASGCSWARRRPPDALACAAGRRAGAATVVLGVAVVVGALRVAGITVNAYWFVFYSLFTWFLFRASTTGSESRRPLVAAARRVVPRRWLVRTNVVAGLLLGLGVGTYFAIGNFLTDPMPASAALIGLTVGLVAASGFMLHGAMVPVPAGRGRSPRPLGALWRSGRTGLVTGLMVLPAGRSARRGHPRRRPVSGRAGLALPPPHAGRAAGRRLPRSPGGRPVTRSRLRNLRRHRPPARSDAGHRGRAAHHRCGARDVVRSAASGYPRVTSHRRS